MTIIGNRCRLLCVFLLLAISGIGVQAQNADRSAREDLWNSYKLPEGKFNRHFDQLTGIIFRTPDEWKEGQISTGGTYYGPKDDTATFTYVSEPVADGLGTAPYFASMLQGLRKEWSLEPDLVVMRTLKISGIEWHEISYDIPGDGNNHQTAFVTTHAGYASVFYFTVNKDHKTKYEPFCKRIMSSVRIVAGGHWDSEYEPLREKITTGSQSTKDTEYEVLRVVESYSKGRESFDIASEQLSKLFITSPESVIDIVTDINPQVRTVAVAAIAKSSKGKLSTSLNDLMLWLMKDKDLFVSAIASQFIAANDTADGIESKLSKLVDNIPSLIRLSKITSPLISNKVIDKFFAGDNPKEHMAALQMVLELNEFHSQIPFENLLTLSDIDILKVLKAVLKHHQNPNYSQQLKTLIGANSKAEYEALGILGEVGSTDLIDLLTGHLNMIKQKQKSVDDELIAKSKSSKNRKTSSKSSKSELAASETMVMPPPPMSGEAESYASNWKNLNEATRLIMLKDQVDLAIRKINCRDRLNKAKNSDERKAIANEIRKSDYGVLHYCESSIPVKSPDKHNLDFAVISKLQAEKNIPTTGETIFPKDIISYISAPDFAKSLEKFDSALTGIKMPTIRDQMTMAVFINSSKSQLASNTGADMTGDVSLAIGADLNSPVSMASWYSDKDDSNLRSGLTFKVIDRMRFERAMAGLNNSYGKMNNLVLGTAVISRFGGMLSSMAPGFVVAFLSNQEMAANLMNQRNVNSTIPTPIPFTYIVREQTGNLPITQIVTPIINYEGGATWQSLFITYINDTAILTSTRESMQDLANTVATGVSFAKSDGYKSLQSENGDIRFYSKLNTILKNGIPFDKESSDTNKMWNYFLSTVGGESGSLQLTNDSIETSFKLDIADSDILKSVKPFKVDQLIAPASILPKNTIFYAGTIIDPLAMEKAVETLGKNLDLKEEYDDKSNKIIKEIIDKLCSSNMEGEVSAALISLDPVLKYRKEMPSFAFLIKLKEGNIAKLIQDEKLIKAIDTLKIDTVNGNPVFAVGENNSYPFVTIINDFMVYADSVDTLRLFENKEKLATSDDYVKSKNTVPENLSLYITYDFDSMISSASKLIGDENTKSLFSFLTSYANAFHSKRAYFIADNTGIKGDFSVSFDKEGRYSVGDVANSAKDIDLLNAEVIPKGQVVLDSTKLESMTMKIKGKISGMGQKLHDDFAGFDFQKVEIIDDTSIILNTSVRRIPAALSIKLPVSGAEFAPYLKSTGNIKVSDPQTITLAKEIVGDDKDGRSVAVKIGEWTFKNLKWKRVSGDSTQTLATREADCLEHSELYVALARSVGLPARVVSGFAMSGGGFGAHAWVEVYLGKWVELDPTWSLMEYVDASHIRTEGDSPFHAVMLKQLEFDITSIRRRAEPFQSDPIRLIKEFAKNEGSVDAPFDLTLTAERVFGRERLSSLDDKQRSRITTAFTKQVKEISDEWLSALTDESPYILQSEINDDTARIIVLRGWYLLRLTLTKRDAAWFITEQEDLDDAWPLFKDALNGAIKPDQKRGYALTAPIELAQKHVDKLIAVEGETAELMLLKSRVMRQQQYEALSQDSTSESNKKDDNISTEKKAKLPNPVTEYLKKIVEKYPDFAPVKYELAGNLILSIIEQESPDPLSNDVKLFFKELTSYQRLMPYDSRAWHRMTDIYDALHKYEDSATAYEHALSIIPENLEYHKLLIKNYVSRNLLNKAEPAFIRMQKYVADDETIFFHFHEEDEEYKKEYAASLETLFLKFPKAFEDDSFGYVLLAELQEAQEKYSDSVKSYQRSIEIESNYATYIALSRIYILMNKFDEALKTIDDSIKLKADSSIAYYNRAVALAHLNRHKEAVESLKKMLELDIENEFLLEDEELKPLESYPEFKALLDSKKKSE